MIWYDNHHCNVVVIWEYWSSKRIGETGQLPGTSNKQDHCKADGIAILLLFVIKVIIPPPWNWVAAGEASALLGSFLMEERLIVVDHNRV